MRGNRGEGGGGLRRLQKETGNLSRRERGGTENVHGAGRDERGGGGTLVASTAMRKSSVIKRWDLHTPKKGAKKAGTGLFD